MREQLTHGQRVNRPYSKVVYHRVHANISHAEVSERLSVTYAVLFRIIRDRRIDVPPKNHAGDYQWDSSHIDAARAIIEARRARRQLPPSCSAMPCPSQQTDN